jgi:TRAP-type C4-dicarboxylate transport system substrate-binding protein
MKQEGIMKKLLSIVTLIIITSLVFAGCSGSGDSSSSAQQSSDASDTQESADLEWVDTPEYEWIGQSVALEGTTHYESVVEFCDLVYQQTGGRVKITPFSSGTLHGTQEGYDAIMSGLTQVTWVAPDYLSGREMMLKLRSFRNTDPQGWTYEQADDFWERTTPLVDNALENMGLVHIGNVYCQPSESFHTNVEVKTMEDFSKLTIRSAGLGQELFEALGATVVNLTMDETYTGAQLNMIDAFEVGGIMDNYKTAFHEVCKYTVEPTVHVTSTIETGMMFALPEVWNTLTPELQQIVRDCAKETRRSSYDKTVEINKEGKVLFEQAGVQTIQLNEGEAERIALVAADVLSKYWTESELCAQYLDIYVEWLRDIGASEIADRIAAGRP